MRITYTSEIESRSVRTYVSIETWAGWYVYLSMLQRISPSNFVCVGESLTNEMLFRTFFATIQFQDLYILRATERVDQSIDRTHVIMVPGRSAKNDRERSRD